VSPNPHLSPPSFLSILYILDWIHENYKILSLSDPLFSSVLTESNHKADPSIWQSLRITSNGNIYPSTYLVQDKFKLGDIQEIQTLQDLLRKDEYKRFTSIPIPVDCESCSKVKTCQGGTIDRRFLWHHDGFKGRDPYCPQNYGLPTNLRKYSISQESFSSIHDGYLPTLFFGN
jgi:radical SAM protein with 4Fe4S-binding SPASM domain